MMCAGKLLQSGATLHMNDLKMSGKTQLRMIRDQEKLKKEKQLRKIKKDLEKARTEDDDVVTQKYGVGLPAASRVGMVGVPVRSAGDSDSD